MKEFCEEEMGMNCYDWPIEFRKVYEAGQKRYAGGERVPEKLFPFPLRKTLSHNAAFIQHKHGARTHRVGGEG